MSDRSCSPASAGTAPRSIGRSQIVHALRHLDVATRPPSGRAPRHSDYDLNVPLAPEPAPLTPAAVLVPLVSRERLHVLLTRRTQHLRHHAGQVSFPGGRMEEHDTDVRVTALRETHEEVGIEPRHVSVIGYLGPMPTITGYAVTPVVGLVHESAELVIDRTEVEFAFEVPLDFLLDEANDRLVEREFQVKSYPMIEFHYEGHRIWGATAQMLLIFRKYLINK